MSREIVFKTRAKGDFTTASANEKNDTFLERVVKLVPADVISVYLAVFNVIKNGQQPGTQPEVLQWIIFGFIVVLLPFYLRKLGRIKSLKQIIICEFSFLIWVLSIGGPVEGLKLLGYPTQFIAAIIVPLYTLFTPWLAYLEPENPADGN